MLSLEGLAIGDAFGEMLAYNCASARQRVERGLMGGPWFHTDDTQMALSIFEVLQSHGRIDPNELALRVADRFRKEPERGYGAMARVILRAILGGDDWQQAAASAFGGSGSIGNPLKPLARWLSPSDVTALTAWLGINPRRRLLLDIVCTFGTRFHPTTHRLLARQQTILLHSLTKGWLHPRLFGSRSCPNATPQR